jgi:hypothetical protein
MRGGEPGGDGTVEWGSGSLSSRRGHHGHQQPPSLWTRRGAASSHRGWCLAVKSTVTHGRRRQHEARGVVAGPAAVRAGQAARSLALGDPRRCPCLPLLLLLNDAERGPICPKWPGCRCSPSRRGCQPG